MSKKTPRGVMGERLFHKIISEIKELESLKWITFNMQNEPLLDKDIYEKIECIKSKTNIRVSITTNGYYLNKRNILKLIKVGTDGIIVSLNAFTPEKYKKITANNYFDRIVKNIETLISLKPLELKFILSFVVIKDNFKELEDFQAYWKSRGITTRTIYANNRAGILEDHSFLPLKRECRVPFEEINILYSGEVVLCRQDWNNSVIFGNLNTSSIKQIWWGKNLGKFRERFEHNIDQVFPCNRCNRNKSAVFSQ